LNTKFKSFVLLRCVHCVKIQSAKDYLLSPENAAISSPGLGEENGRIATRCFQYICTEAFPQISDERTRPAEDLETDQDTPSYLEYPVLDWMEHGRLASQDIADDFNWKDEFFQQDSELRLAWFHEYWKKRHWLGTVLYESLLLHLAAYSGLLWLAGKLVDSGHESDVNRSHSFSRTPRRWAAKKWHEAVVRLLLQHKADVNAKGISGCTALHQAAEKGQEAVVQLLLEYKADVNRSDSCLYTTALCS
jgi:Ankyrin repeats (3 copies)